MNPEPWDELVGPLEDAMIHSIWRVVRDAHDAEDALQDALTIVWRKFEQVRRHSNPRALILRICIDSACDAVRKSSGRKRRERGRSVPESTAAVPDAAIAQVELQEEIGRAIARLSRPQATAILMRCVHEEDYGSIADALECSEVTARTHVARARKRLRSLLSHLAPFPSPPSTEKCHDDQ